MAAPTWVSGQVLNASDVNNWFVPLAVYKTSSTSRSSTTTNSPDPDLVIPLAVSAFYRFEMYASYTGSSTASQGIKGAFTVPTGTTLRYHLIGVSNSGSTAQVGGTWTGTDTIILGTTNAVNSGFSLLGTLFTSTTAGSISYNWSQSVSESTAVSLQAQSCMILTRIG